MPQSASFIRWYWVWSALLITSERNLRVVLW